MCRLKLAAAVGLALVAGAGVRARPSGDPDIALFLQATQQDERRAKEALDRIAAGWKDGYAAIFVDLARFMRPARRAVPGSDTGFPPPAEPDEDAGRPQGAESGAARTPGPGDAFAAAPRSDPSSRIRERLIRFLERRTGQRFGDDLNRWREWMWNQPYDPHPDYALFKGAVYARIDKRMRDFFPPGARALIRLDEIDWGGVRVNGIPPLDHPSHITAREASYLKDSHVVFGITLDGEARAYPKRILAWHEMARDRVGGIELTIVYCTLCGTVIPYESEIGGKLRTFGTSGLLYRSNKLMFDDESLSLWSTLEGTPVVGALAGSNLQLPAHPVVTTTWGEWKSEHPDTTVLSLETGYKRDYSEGAAYHDYFATDQLMFQVPATDNRLKHKAEVLTLLLTPAFDRDRSGADNPAGHDSRTTRQPLAIAAELLRKNPVYHISLAGHSLVIVTSPRGANRVYEAGSARFTHQRDGGRIEDAEGQTWRVTEAALVAERDPAVQLPRVAAQRAFWFGWYAQFPDTELVR